MNRNAISAGLFAASLFGAVSLASAQVQPPPGAGQEPPQTGTQPTSPPADASGQAQQQGGQTQQQQATSPAKNPPTVAPDNPALQKLRMSKIVGAEVNNKEGNKIGDIEDVIVDEKGNASLAIVSSGGILGTGKELRAVPWSELKPGAEGGSHVLEMTKEQLEKAPSFESDQWPTLNEQWLEDNRSFYERN